MLALITIYEKTVRGENFLIRVWDIFLIALAPELDPRYEHFFSFLQDDVTKTLGQPIGEVPTRPEASSQ